MLLGLCPQLYRQFRTSDKQNGHHTDHTTEEIMSTTNQPQIKYIRETGMASNSLLFLAIIIITSSILQEFKVSATKDTGKPTDPPVFDAILLTHGHLTISAV